MAPCKATKSHFYHPSEALPATKGLQNVTVINSGVLIPVFVNKRHFKLNFKDISCLTEIAATQVIQPYQRIFR